MVVEGRSGSLAEVGAQLRHLASEIESYLANIPAGDRYFPPIIDWHHPDEYAQNGVQGLSKFLHHVAKESAIVDALLVSPSPPVDYSTNLVSLQGVWDAFVRAPRPLVGVWQAMDRARAGPGPVSVKVDVVAAGGDEWVKINTIKESRLLVEFREHDSYINSDYDSDSDSDSESGSESGDGAGPGAEMTNSLIKQARALVDAAAAYGRIPGLRQPRIRYVLTRLEENPAGGHADRRIPATFEAMRDLGIQLEFATQWGDEPSPLLHQTEALPAPDIVLDLSVLIALCCDSTHYPLPKDEDELEKRFRLLTASDFGPGHSDTEAANGSTGGHGNGEANGETNGGNHTQEPKLAPHTGATRDLRDQLRCEMARPLIQELRDRLDAAGVSEPRFWCTREVYARLPGLVEVIGGGAERQRAKALFDPTLGDFWEGSRWHGNTGCLTCIRVRVLDEEIVPDSPEMWAPFDTVVAHICERMVASAGDASPPAREPTPGPTKPVHPKKKKDTEPGFKTTKTVKNKNKDKHKSPNPSRNPLRQGTNFPPSSRLPSGHTLRTLLAGIRMRATVLTNNRGAVLKVMREAGVTDGIPTSDGIPGTPDKTAETRARVWVVNPSSLAEWRRIEVEENNRRITAEASM